MDQFRGYTVAGMLVVNFLGAYAAITPFWKHNNNYFSYADTIMPSFLFCCGFSYRLSASRRIARDGLRAAVRHYLGRCLGLVLVSLAIFGAGQQFPKWADLTSENIHHFLGKLLKADLWEVLAIIGVAQLIALPVITRSVSTRLLAIAGLLGLHLLLSAWFNFDFVSGRPTRLDTWLGTTGSSAWDGGLFGVLQWTAILLAGSIATDVVTSASPGRSGGQLIATGAALMALAYGLSCLSMLYDGEPSAEGKGDVAVSPVWPPFDRAEGKPIRALLAEPPFVQPPDTKHRPNNYWMMNKRIVTLPFVLVGVGFASLVYGAFVLVVDGKGGQLGLFRTFGTNPLAAYGLHHLVEEQVHAIVPKDASLWACLLGLAVFYLISYAFVRALEKQGVFIRL